jgi:hypothetical protein
VDPDSLKPDPDPAFFKVNPDPATDLNKLGYGSRVLMTKVEEKNTAEILFLIFLKSKIAI